MDEPLYPPSSPRLTPKRKRDDLITEQRIASSPIRNMAHLHLARPVFSFQPSTSQDLQPYVPEDGNSSPRAKVAQKFQDLTLNVKDSGDKREESGGGVTTSATNINKNNHQSLLGTDPPNLSPEPVIFGLDGVNPVDEDTQRTTMAFLGEDMQVDDDDDGIIKKRIKCFEEGSHPLEPKLDISTGPKGEDSANAADPVQVTETQDTDKAMLPPAVDPTLVKLSKSGGNGCLQKSYPSINRLKDSKSRSRRRAGTPPVSSKRKTTTPKVEEEPEIVDPIRAALTWQEDEITVYDPEDQDDDRRGMDGIGFKPSPAIAYQRDQMRRRQLADYKRREESEARARRNQRRREQLGSGDGGPEGKHSIVRVHFSDAEPTTVVTT